ncbi:MAG: F0F1 ATP synthase subunit epsilon [Alphaproteobacteria bacterium]
MAERLHFDLVTPERLFLSEEVDMVTVPGAEGDFGVLRDHAPFMSAIRRGVIDVTRNGAALQRIFVQGGFAEVTPAGLTVLAEQALPLDEVDPASLDQDMRNMEEDLAAATSEEERARIAEELANLRALRASL